MHIQRMMIARCKLRIMLIIIISLATGFISSVVLDSVFNMKYAENLFSQESMQDTLWLEFDSKGGYASEGYNSYWINNINALKTIPGIRNIGVQVGLYSRLSGENIIAISESLLSRMKIPVSVGKWDFSTSEQSVLPAVVSYDLSPKYPIGTTVPVQVWENSEDDTSLITAMIVGIMNEFGGLPRLNVGRFISNPKLRNILYWHNLRNTLIIPLDTLPWSNELV